MRGTSRPSDYISDGEPARKPPASGSSIKHGDRFGSLRVEGVPFRDQRRRLSVHVRCSRCRATRVVVVYHLVRALAPKCTSCGWSRWNRAPACGPKKARQERQNATGSDIDEL